MKCFKSSDVLKDMYTARFLLCFELNREAPEMDLEYLKGILYEKGAILSLIVEREFFSGERYDKVTI